LKIFRYYKSEHGLKVLNDLEIRASIPTELNDPFELSPTIDAAQFGQRHLEALMRQDYHIDRAYRLEGRQRKFGSKKEFKRWYLKDVPRRAAEQLPKVRKNVEAEMRKFALRFGKYWRLICASEVHDSVLMWSHYADKHMGLVLEFDASQPPFSQIPNDCWLTMKYSDKKPNYIYSHKEREFRRNVFAVAASKAIRWSYEKEIRIVLPDTSLRDGRFLRLTPESIAAVYCGCLIAEADKTAVQTALKSPQLTHVELRLGTLDESEYVLKFGEIAPNADCP
jgi:hypothetical protein